MDMEIDSDVSNRRLSLRSQDAEIMVQQLRERLKPYPYTPYPYTHMEEFPPSGLPGWNDLESMFAAATDKELKSALRRVPAVEFDGRWRYVDDLYIGEVLYHLVVQVLVLEDSLSLFRGHDVVKSVVDTYGLSRDIARHCLELYASTTDGSVWEFDSQRAYPYLARWIIASYGERMEIQEFFNRWACLKFPLSINLLEGKKIIVVKCYGNRTWISLPPDDQNHSRSSTPTMENTDDEVDSNDLNIRLSLRNEDAGATVLELRVLLLQNPYIPMEESSQDQHLFKWDDLKSRFDATDEELKSALRLVPAVEINGHWRALDVMYTGQLLYSLVERVECNSAFDGNRLLNCLAYEGCSPDIARLCLELCASTADGRVWKLDSELASVEIARWLIASYGGRMESQDLMRHWSILGFSESLDMLADKVLVKKTKESTWVYFNPEDRMSRFYEQWLAPAEEEVFEMDVLPQRNEDPETLEQKLKALVLQNTYKVDEDLQGGQKHGLHKWDDLKSMLDATDEELGAALRRVSALEIDGYWRILEDMCIYQVLYFLVWVIDVNDWSYNSLDLSKVVEALGGGRHKYTQALVVHCFKLYASKTDGEVWELDTKRVSVELARWILKNNNGKMEFQDFMTNWTCVGLPVSVDWLEGDIVVEQRSWVYLSSEHNALTSASREMH